MARRRIGLDDQCSALAAVYAGGKDALPRQVLVIENHEDGVRVWAFFFA